MGTIILVGDSDHTMTVETAGHMLQPDDTVKVGELITVTFTIQNNDTHPIRIKRLIAGGRGPGVKCSDWNGTPADFPGVNNILLKPGEVYEYHQSHFFSAMGHYFIAPAYQSADGGWGGMGPYTCINFEVVK
jgi:hypothetical protein